MLAYSEVESVYKNAYNFVGVVIPLIICLSPESVYQQLSHDSFN